MIFNTTGGGNTKPNLRVILCTIQPENPSENTFWVKIGSETPMEYLDYVFSSNKPLDPHDGLLWFKTGLSSYYAFPIVKGAEVYIYPNRCYRYVANSGWTEMPVNVYMYGEWRDMKYSHLYLPYNECTQITGGWSGMVKPYSKDSGTPSISVDKTNGKVSMIVNSAGSILKTNNKIDLTSYSKIVFVGSYTENATTANAWYGAWSEIGATYQENIGAVTKVTANNSDNVVVDISKLTGEYFVGVGLRSSEVAIKECYLIV